MSIPVDEATDTELRFTAPVPATAGEYTLVLLDDQGREVGSAADVVSVVATPTAPVIFDVWPREVYAHTPTQFTVWGWLLDPADCIGLDSPTAGATNWSGLDFTNTGIVIPWENTLNAGTWNWHAKQGGSGGTVIASKNAAVVAHPVELVSVVPDVSTGGVSTTYTVTLTAGVQYVGVVRLIDANGVAQPDIPMPENPTSTTEFSFTVTLPAGVYDIECWYWMLAEKITTFPDAITVTDPV